MSFDENNIIFKQYFIPDKYDKSLIFSKTLQDYIAGIKGLKLLLAESFLKEIKKIFQKSQVCGNTKVNLLQIFFSDNVS